MRLSSAFFPADGHEDAGPRLPLVILHGLFGRKRNWRSVATALAKRRDVWTIDLRSHGESPIGELSFDAIADDLREFIEEQQLEKPVVLGHSLGGKAAFEYVRSYPNGASGLVIVDVTPFEIPEEVCRGLRDIAEALTEIDLGSVSSRGEAQQLLASKVGAEEIAAFLLQNAERDGGIKTGRRGFRWREGTLFAAGRISEVCRGVLQRGGVLQREGPQRVPGGWTGPVLLVRGGRSLHFPESDREDFFRLFPAAEEQVVEGAGHWLHISHQAEFVGHVEHFLERL